MLANPDTDEPNAAIFSASDLTIFGNGSLTVYGNNNDGIASKDGLIIASGTHHGRRRWTTASGVKITWWSKMA